MGLADATHLDLADYKGGVMVHNFERVKLISVNKITEGGSIE